MKILDIALKDLTRSFRSAFAIGMMVVAPLMLTGLIYFAFGGMSSGDVSMTAIKVGVVKRRASVPSSCSRKMDIIELPPVKNAKKIICPAMVKPII